jgi:hypothetical protein
MKKKLGLLVFLLASTYCAAEEPPKLTVSSDGVGGVWLKLPGINEGESWIIQDSYDGITWRDMKAFVVPSFHAGALRQHSVRLFRASTRPLDSPQQLLTKARQNWETLGLTDYQYVPST